MKPLARWTIGNVQKGGFESLALSIESFQKFYDVEVVICYNCKLEQLPSQVMKYKLIDQSHYIKSKPVPKGVAWKLYPPRLVIERHEIIIDNDIIFQERIEQIDQFFSSDCTLLLEGDSRTYGRFERHVPPGFQINSGIYGMPPRFDFSKYVNFYAGDAWEKNAFHEHDRSETFDEQGLVALALLSYNQYLLIPNTIVTNCKDRILNGKGLHFIGLNRRQFHSPFQLFRSQSKKLHL